MKKGEPQSLAGIAEAIAYTKPVRILFQGDSDTATNFAFALNAVFLANALKPLAVLLPRISVGGPGKGIDDCREALGDKFPEFWHALIESAEEIDLKVGPGALAVRLVEREAEAIKASVGTERDKLDRRVVRMAAECKEPLWPKTASWISPRRFWATPAPRSDRLCRKRKRSEHTRRWSVSRRRTWPNHPHLTHGSKKDFPN
jgi:hypothetical protein